MITALKKFVTHVAQLRRRREVIRALDLNRGVRKYWLSLKSMRFRLKVEWRARRIHPWEQDLLPEQAAKRFVQQCLEDIDVAISWLFATLPDTNEVELRVLDPNSGSPIVAGTVTRSDAAAAKSESIGMKLKSLGLVFRLTNWQFEPLGI